MTLPLSNKMPKENRLEYILSGKANIPNGLICGEKVSSF
jgi:hypothetical protein